MPYVREIPGGIQEGGDVDLVHCQKIDFGQRLPLEQASDAVADVTREHSARVEAARAQATQAAGLYADYNASRRDLLGHEGFERLKRLSSSRGPDSRQGAEITADFIRRYRAEQHAKKQKLLAELRIDGSALRSLAKRWFTDLERTLPQALPVRDVHPPKVILEAADLPDYLKDVLNDPPLKRPKPKPEQPPDPWTVFYAPYPMKEEFCDGWLSDGAMSDHKNYAETWDARVGQTVDLHGSEMLSQLECTARLGVFYKMPAHGRLEIVVEVERTDFMESEHFVSLVDEWGASDAFAWTMNWISMRARGINNPAPQEALTSGYKVSGDEEGHYHHNLPPGDSRVIVFETSEGFVKDEWVHIFVGSHSWNRASSDDMWVRSFIKFEWSVMSTSVRTITGAP
jgi:hypothetical protein